MSDTVKIELTPFQAMQICRWKTFILSAVNDPFQDAEKYDRKGLTEAIQSIDKQVRKNITIAQLDDTEATKAIRKQLGL